MVRLPPVRDCDLRGGGLWARNAAARAGLGTNLNLVSVYADLYVVNKSLCLPSLQTFTNSQGCIMSFVTRCHEESEENLEGFRAHDMS